MNNKDILYYSNNCKYCEKILNYLVKNDIIKHLNCICVDKRQINQLNGNVNIILENGNSVMLPPNVHSVPSLLILKENYRVVMGEDILKIFNLQVQENNDIATQGNGEPISYTLGSKDVSSEVFSSFNASPEDLSAKGQGGNRPLYNYVSASGSNPTIQTPPDTYKPDKLSSDVTVESLNQSRNEQMKDLSTPNLFIPSS